MAINTNLRKSKKALNCSVITKEGPIIRSMRIDHVEIPSRGGYVSIYLDHCPYMANLRYGELRIYDEEEKLISLYVDGGIAEVTQNVVGILAEKVLYPKDIDVESLKERMEKLSKKTAVNLEELDRNREEADKCRKQIEIASKLKRP